MNPIKKNRQKVLDFLADPKNKKAWNFGDILEGDTKKITSNFKAKKSLDCGTVCCLHGSMPLLFPNLVKWEDDHVISKKNQDSEAVIADELGISENDYTAICSLGFSNASSDYNDWYRKKPFNYTAMDSVKRKDVIKILKKCFAENPIN